MGGWVRQVSKPWYDGAYPTSARAQGNTITGIGFGTKDSTTPHYEDFEAETLGSVTSPVGSIKISYSNYTTIIDTDSNSGSKCISTDFGQNSTFPKAYIDLLGTKSHGYFSCALKFSGTTLSSGAVWKNARLGAGSVYSGYPHAGFAHTGNSSTVPLSTGSELLDANGTLQAWGNIQGHNDAPLSSDGYVGDLYQSGVWQFYEVEWYTGTQDGLDSYFVCRVNGNVETLWQNRPFLTSANPVYPTWFLTPITGMGTQQPIVYNMDDVYIDETRNRVVMTDNATYASSTKWATQPVTAWSDTSITYTKKRQGFTIGETAYLHVFDSTGTLVHTTAAFNVSAD